MTTRKSWSKILGSFRNNSSQWSPHIVKSLTGERLGTTIELFCIIHSVSVLFLFRYRERALMGISSARSSRTVSQAD